LSEASGRLWPDVLATWRNPVPVNYQLVIDCADPDLMAQFWAGALGYEIAPPPAGYASWKDFYREKGVPEEDLIDGADRISDPRGQGPVIWFHAVDETKVVKNRLHFDIRASDWSDPIETRRKAVDAEASRLASLGAIITGPLGDPEDDGHYAVGMRDPEGNEFDIN
jgi:hypothetical protein